jgi:hypothetical protein
VRRALLLVAITELALVAPPALAATDARAIVDRVDRLLRGNSSEGELVMAVATRRWTRTLTLRVWSQWTERALIKGSEEPWTAPSVPPESIAPAWRGAPRSRRRAP